METPKFKVGDKVRVKSLEWYNNQQKDMYGDIHDGITFIKDMVRYCGKILSIIKLHDDTYGVDETSYIWQDWMLEDEAVTEEKQEVEQANKYNMETKEMTQEEVFEYLKNKKIRCESKEESEKVQKKLFELGYAFRNSGKKILSTYLLYIIDNFKLLFENYYDSWIENERREIEPREIFAIQIKEEPKPKFDPNTLQPFDKVLVRDCDDATWACSIFSHVIHENEDRKFLCILSLWRHCIPYNEETKHLLGSCEEAPEFYKLD